VVVAKGRDWDGFLAHAFECRQCATMPLDRGCPEGIRVRRRLPVSAVSQGGDAAGAEALPVDAETMRSAVARLLAPGAELPAGAELDELMLLYQGALRVLITEVERACLGRPEGDVVAVGALAGGGEALRRLELEVRASPLAQLAHAQRLARSVDCLLDHLDSLSGVDRTVEAHRVPVMDWLLSATESPDGAFREWDRQGMALLPCGTLFSAVRIPEAIVHAAVLSMDDEEVDARLAVSLLGGPVICDTVARRYYALVPAGTTRWKAPDTICLGHGCHLGIPLPGRTGHDSQEWRSYWSVPMESVGALCVPDAVADLVAIGRYRLARQTATEEVRPRLCTRAEKQDVYEGASAVHRNWRAKKAL
jgi:hypothetical protein